MGYAIGDHDLDLKLKKAEELLKEGWNVKCIVRLKGRERSFASKVIENLTKLQERMLHVARPQYPHPKQEAAGYSIILMPKTAQTHGK
jgi:translation initiation factor IF-3